MQKEENGRIERHLLVQLLLRKPCSLLDADSTEPPVESASALLLCVLLVLLLAVGAAAQCWQLGAFPTWSDGMHSSSCCRGLGNPSWGFRPSPRSRERG